MRGYYATRSEAGRLQQVVFGRDAQNRVLTSSYFYSLWRGIVCFVCVFIFIFFPFWEALGAGGYKVFYTWQIGWDERRRICSLRKK